MDRLFTDAPERSQGHIKPLDLSAYSAITALSRALEVFDRPASRRAALRAHVANRIAGRAGVPMRERVDAFTGALLSEIGILLTHVRPVGTVDIVADPASAVLSATMLDRLPGLSGTSDAVRHQYERWDGSGGPHGSRGTDIPLAARLLALSATLVGQPAAGQPPNWTARRRRVEELLGTSLDPDLGAAAILELESGPEMTSTVTLDHALAELDEFLSVEVDSPIDALVSMDAVIRAAGHTDKVLFAIAQQAHRALGADIVSIGQYDEHTGRVTTLVNASADPEIERYPTGEVLDPATMPGLVDVVAGEGYLRSIESGGTEDLGVVSLHRRGLRSEAMWPVTIGGTTWGIITARTLTHEHTLDHDHLSILQLVAGQVGTAVAQAERIAEFETLAHRDPLTGLGNRRILEDKLKEVFRRNPVDRQDVAVIMCDVDGLKVINDTEGHAAGDELLVAAAKALKEAGDTVANSIVCRIGGDEYCIVLDGGGMLSAEPVADLARRLFAQTGPGRSLSSGIAFASPDIESPAELLRAADQAQYEQKRRRKALPKVASLSPIRDRRTIRDSE